MSTSLKRRLVYGVLTLVLGLLATRISLYMTDMLVGRPEQT
jgi:hypothetical protein